MLRNDSSKVGLSIAAVILVCTPLAGQETEEDRPEGWEVRLDRGGHGGGSSVSFVDMPPGWHITTGPSCILYDPAHDARGEYGVEAEVFLFDPAGRREGYGVFFGGQGLDGEDQAYTYFLLRRDGRFLIKRRQGSETRTLRGWEEHPAIVSWEERAEGENTVKNVLAVWVGGEAVTFLVNGEEVASLPAAQVDTAGVVGLRVNHSLNLHVSRLDVLEAVEEDAR